MQSLSFSHAPFVDRPQNPPRLALPPVKFVVAFSFMSAFTCPRHPLIRRAGKISIKRGGFINNVEKFDAGFFGIVAG